MLQFDSIELAERNQQEFNTCLNSIPNWTGIKRILIQGNEFFYYDQVNKIFYRAQDLGGYRKMSISSYEPITMQQEEELYHEIGLGVVDICIIDYYNDTMERVWYGKCNIIIYNRHSCVY